MSKRLISITLTLLMVLALAACSSGADGVDAFQAASGYTRENSETVVGHLNVQGVVIKTVRKLENQEKKENLLQAMPEIANDSEMGEFLDLMIMAYDIYTITGQDEMEYRMVLSLGRTDITSLNNQTTGEFLVPKPGN